MTTNEPTAQAIPRPQPPVWLLLALLAEIALHLLLPLAHWLRLPWNLVGLLPVAVGIALNLMADADLKRHATTVKSGLTSTALVTAGAYRLSRHPMYLGFMLLAGGLALLLGSATPWLAVIGLWLVLAWRYVPTEERILATAFGEDWGAYARGVRRWI